MFKLLLTSTLVLMLVLSLPLSALAASWSVTVTWTRSIGPNLTSEQVFLDEVSKCTITPPTVTTCNFTIPTLSGVIKVRSFNSQGAFADTTGVPLQVVPAPATGVIVNVTFIP